MAGRVAGEGRGSERQARGCRGQQQPAARPVRSADLHLSSLRASVPIVTRTVAGLDAWTNGAASGEDTGRRRRTPTLEWIEGRPRKIRHPARPRARLRLPVPPRVRLRAPQRPRASAPRGRPSDVFGGEVRRRDIFTLLVFHLIARSESGASYGNQLIEQIEAITARRGEPEPEHDVSAPARARGRRVHRGPVGAPREAQPPPVHAHGRGRGPSTSASSRAWSRSSTRSSTASR